MGREGYHGEEVLASDFVRDVDAAVRRTRADWKWRRVWMNMQEKLYDAKREGEEIGFGKGHAKGREEGLEEGRAEGLEQGIEIGALRTVAGLVADGLITLEQAAARLDVSEDAIRKQMDELSA